MESPIVPNIGDVLISSGKKNSYLGEVTKVQGTFKDETIVITYYRRGGEYLLFPEIYKKNKKIIGTNYHVISGPNAKRLSELDEELDDLQGQFDNIVIDNLH